MSEHKCPACGGILNVAFGSSYYECEFCNNRGRLNDVATSATCESLTQHGEICLQNGRWSQAKNCFQRALDISPTYGPAHYGNLLADLQCRDDIALGERTVSFRQHTDYQNAVRYGDAALCRKLNEALRKAEENERRIADHEAQKRREAEELAARHELQRKHLKIRNRICYLAMWLGTFLHMIVAFTCVVATGAIDEPLFEGFYLFCHAPMIISMIFMHVYMSRKANSRLYDHPLGSVLLFMSPSFLFVIICFIVSVNQSEPYWFLNSLLILMPVLHILAAPLCISPLDKLREKQNNERNNL